MLAPLFCICINMNKPIVGLILSLVLTCACSGGDEKQVSQSESGKTISTADSLTQLIEQNPSSREARINRAKYFENVGNKAGAISDRVRALELDSSRSDDFSALGQLEFDGGDFDASRKHFQSALRINPADTTALLGMARIELALGNHEQSLKLLNEALKIDDQLARAYFIKGFLYLDLRDTTLAKSSFSTATEVNPSYYDAFMMLGVIAQRQQSDLAPLYYSSALDIDPQSVEARINRGLYFQDNNNADEALADYQAALAIDSTNAVAAYNTGYVYLVLKEDPEQSIVWFSRAVKFVPGYFEAWYNLGYAYELIGEKQQAAEMYRKSLSYNENYVLAQEGLQRLR